MFEFICVCVLLSKRSLDMYLNSLLAMRIPTLFGPLPEDKTYGKASVDPSRYLKDNYIHCHWHVQWQRK